MCSINIEEAKIIIEAIEQYNHINGFIVPDVKDLRDKFDSNNSIYFY
jgi:hypothetical protein